MSCEVRKILYFYTNKDKFYKRNHENEEKIAINTIDGETTQRVPSNIE